VDDLARQLVAAGYTPASVAVAVAAADLSLLVHPARVEVRLRDGTP
jgi:hypothetical protein